MKCKWINLAAVLGVVLAAWQPFDASARNDKTRGLGVYPGRPAEYFGPQVVAGGSEYRNVALFRAASHSSSADYNRTAQLVTDGLFADGTYADGKVLQSTWKSGSNKNEWIAVDLGSVSKIDKVKFHWVNAPVVGTVQVSIDDKEWSDVATIGAATEITFPTVNARYVRAKLASTANDAPFELGEFEVFGRGGTKTVPAKAAKREGNHQSLAGGNWKLCRATEVKASGEELSRAGYDDSAWMHATVPGTVLASYLNVGAIHDPKFADHQEYVSDLYFCNDFWYRKSFEARVNTERQYIHFHGINFKAEVYLNGQLVDKMVGAFREYNLDVTGILKNGRNDLAIKIIRNDHYGVVKNQTVYHSGKCGGEIAYDNPTMHASQGWDWMQTVRGRNIGIYDDLYVRYTGAVCVEDPFVRTELSLPDTTKAMLLAEATLVNHSDKPVTGVLKGCFGELTFEKEATLAPGEEKIVTWDPLTLENPKLWWPRGYGAPNLYDVNFTFEVDGKISDICSFKSGVRQMEFKLYDYQPVAHHYFRTPRNRNQRLDLYINGRRVTGFGGNWGFPEFMLNYREREYDIAVGFHADQNFNLIRNWVGMTGSRHFYEACDRHGVLVWQDFWLANPNDGPNPADPKRFNETAREYVRLIRNHPSLAIYCGRNENYPPEVIDTFLMKMVPEEHPGMFYISHSAADGVGGGGPYEINQPKKYFGNGMQGADKLHSERGMPSILNYENLVRAMGVENVNPVSTMATPNKIYGVHDYSLGGVPGWIAQKTETFNKYLEKAFGAPADAKEFTELSQWACYEGFRAIFEGRSNHRRGLLLWMSHSAWPSLVWQTYDYYFEPLASYFGCRKGCEPLHILYNPLDNKVEVVNYSAGNRTGLKAVAKILDINGKEVWSNSTTLDIDEDDTKTLFTMQVPTDITDVYFYRLYLYSADNQLLSENFYWQGKEEGNWKALRTVPQVDVVTKVSGKKGNLTATIANNSTTPALMLRVKVVDSKTGDLILPAWYSDNYFFLMGGESKTVTINVRDEDCKGKPLIKVEGYNLK